MSQQLTWLVYAFTLFVFLPLHLPLPHDCSQPVKLLSSAGETISTAHQVVFTPPYNKALQAHQRRSTQSAWSHEWRRSQSCGQQRCAKTACAVCPTLSWSSWPCPSLCWICPWQSWPIPPLHSGAPHSCLHSWSAPSLVQHKRLFFLALCKFAKEINRSIQCIHLKNQLILCSLDFSLTEKLFLAFLSVAIGAQFQSCSHDTNWNRPTHQSLWAEI